MKTKTCSFCQKEVPKLWYSSPPCCLSYACKRAYSELESEKDTDTPKEENNGSNQRKTNVFQKHSRHVVRQKRKTTGELRLFLQIFAERKGICEITGQPLKFNVWCFAHILSKKAFPSFRLRKENIIMVLPEIHHYYDNSDRETLLRHYPKADVIYQRKEELKAQYSQDPNIKK